MKKKLSVLVFCTFLLACQHGPHREVATTPEKKVVCQSTTRGEIKRFSPPPSGAVKVAFFDADSTLRVAPSGEVSANTPTDVQLLPNVGRLLGMLQKNGYLIYIVSNQNGVGTGRVECETAEGSLLYTIQEVFKAGGVVHGYDFAENNDEFRKPKIGMALALEKKIKRLYGSKSYIDKTQSFMVGDSAFKKKNDSDDPEKKYEGDWKLDFQKLILVKGTHFSNADRLFAQNYNIHFYEATDFFGWREHGVDVLDSLEAVEALLKKCGKDCER